ncbi:hypothetical protein DFH08DRAFT_817494 [Mycena albidolilacea]|uniref:Uncharacterized protein n=1 Tax=Mycena albidolilacea TaxID=1033008 RepID=A0AAD7EHR2_9AGAR|nr:hypothetical protein DFH08DRAFT_817494 [Mycena albidolilacea]
MLAVTISWGAPFWFVLTHPILGIKQMLVIRRHGPNRNNSLHIAGESITGSLQAEKLSCLSIAIEKFDGGYDELANGNNKAARKQKSHWRGCSVEADRDVSEPASISKKYSTEYRMYRTCTIHRVESTAINSAIVPVWFFKEEYLVGGRRDPLVQTVMIIVFPKVGRSVGSQRGNGWTWS